MIRTLRPLAALATVAMTAVISAGCGGTGSSGGTNTASPHAKAVKFAECMRANGVSAFPDPDATGTLTIDAVANGSSLDTSSAAFERRETERLLIRPLTVGDLDGVRRAAHWTIIGWST